MSQKEIEQAFPGLSRSGYRITSPETSDYNCFAWAALDTMNWWSPCHIKGYYWPHGVIRSVTIQSFIDAFGLLGFEPCSSKDLEPGFEKVAIYTDQDGEPTHMARQLESGKWTSKLGNWEDIEHNELAGVEGYYGTVNQILKRRRTPPVLPSTPHP